MEFTTLFEKLLNELVDTLFPTFVEKRAEGASKIEETARKKGSFAILTAYHFAGKVKPYADALRKAKKEDKESHFKEKYKEAYDKLKDLDSISQKEFQMITGTLEAYGEVYIQAKHPRDYSK
jgi:O-glycosyl hydrolase